MSDQLQAERERFEAWFSQNGFEKYRESMWAAWEYRSALSSSQQVREEVLTIPTAQEYLEQERAAANGAWHNGWAECRKYVLDRLKSTPASRDSIPFIATVVYDDKMEFVRGNMQSSVAMTDVYTEAVKIIHQEAGRTLSRHDFDLCIRIAKRALLQSSPKGASTGTERDIPDGLIYEAVSKAHAPPELNAAVQKAYNIVREEASKTQDGAVAWPDRIWLQHDGDCMGLEPDCIHDASWCADQINSTDIEYIRADLASQPSAASGRGEKL
jgi:hypothetical protein